MIIGLPPGMQPRTPAEKAPSESKRIASPDPSLVRASRPSAEVHFLIGLPPTAIAPSERPAPVERPLEIPVPDVPLGAAPAVVPSSGTEAVATAVLPDGTGHSLMTTVLLGRDPAHSTTWPEAELILVIDPAKTVSKTHAAIEVEGARLWAHDFGSTNGTKVAKPGTDAIRIPSRGRIELLVGDVLWLGDFAIRIE